MKLSEKLIALASEVILDGESRFTLRIRRSSVLLDAFNYMDLATEMDLHRLLNIIFYGESSVDAGRSDQNKQRAHVGEVLNTKLVELLLHKLRLKIPCEHADLHTDYFYIYWFIHTEGKFTNNNDALHQMDFLQLGRLVAITILQGGPGIPLFDTPVVDYIITGRISTLSVTDFPKEHQDLVDQASSLKA